MSLARGFKAQAERLADQAWSKLGLGPDDPFDIETYAQSLGARVISADSIVARERLDEIDRLQPFAFSACTFMLPEGAVIVLNPVVGDGRRRSDAAHELAHLVLRHEVRIPERLGDYIFYTGNADQEDEANWLGGCLLLPRKVVVRAAASRMTAEAIAAKYGTTQKMAMFRLNATGAARQLERYRAAKPQP